MTSAINPNNIDGTYPVAGQDNNSQGFRDNFTNIKTNFGFARNEITDLQNNAVLKGALTGTQLNNNMAGSILSNAKLQNMQETRVSLGTVQGAIVLNYAAGPFYTVTTGGALTLQFSNFPAAGTISVARMRLQLDVTDPSHTLFLPSSVTRGTTGIQGFVGGQITFGSTGFFEFEFETWDGGSNVTIFDLNRPLVSGFTNRLQVGSTLALTSAEDLAAAANANLAVSTSYFSTVTAEVASLSAGFPGQIKVLAARDVSLGNMVITVANPAWSGSGTITFSSTGSACTLMYIDSRWFCIGNNGCVFG
jgi:hypothetical protein